MFRFRTFAFMALGLAISSTVSCSAIFAPKDDVQRCGSGSDCDSTGDTRYTAQCVFDPDNLDLDTSKVEKICVAAFSSNVGCDPGSSLMNEQVGMFFADVEGGGPFYNPVGMTCADLGGVLGCPPVGGVCDAGLELDVETNICGDGSGTVYSPSTYAGQDVLDQYCRSFFCDEKFVCDTDVSKCVLCDPDKPFGEGGCGELYVAGAKSCIYQDADEIKSACAAPDSSATNAEFGCEP